MSLILLEHIDVAKQKDTCVFRSDAFPGFMSFISRSLAELGLNCLLNLELIIAAVSKHLCP